MLFSLSLSDFFATFKTTYLNSATPFFSYLTLPSLSSFTLSSAISRPLSVFGLSLSSSALQWLKLLPISDYFQAYIFGPNDQALNLYFQMIIRYLIFMLYKLFSFSISKRKLFLWDLVPVFFNIYVWH